ncbi:beta strand repeat-containing protein [Lichenibacterium minor]|uniref:beta strand repeat-containing protein n=1 Tax=Lichenibacterium minor TaxID=2316528 RepID=UPI0013EAFDF5|nr:hypothetical protein [Lichenibacterium minor]
MDTITITATGGATFDVAASASVPVFQPAIDAAGDIGGLTMDGAGPRVVTQATGGRAVSAALPAGAVNAGIVGIDGTGAVYGTYLLPDPGGSSYTTYSFKDAGGIVATIARPNGAADTIVASVNAAGTAAGLYTDASGSTQAFVLSGTDATPVTVDGQAPPSVQSLAPIDAAGDVAGVYTDASGSPHIFLATGGSAAAGSVPLFGGYTPTSVVAVRDGVTMGTLVYGDRTYGFYILAGTTRIFNAPTNALSAPKPVGFDAHGNIVGTYTDNYGRTQSFVEFVAPDGGQPAWNASPLAFPGPGVKSTAVTGVDGAGTVFGTYTDSSNAPHGFVERGGTFTAVPVPDGVDLATPTGADAAGDVVGFTTSSTRETGNAAFTGRDGAGALLTVAGRPLPDVAHGAVTVDGLGRIVGTVSDSAGNHAFVAGPGSTASFDAAPGARSTSVDGTDAAGDVAGSYIDAQNQSHVYLRTADGTVLPLDPTASTGANFVGMNAAGAVTLTYYDGDGGSHAALYAGGRLTTITPDGAISSDVAFIDDAGDVFGSFDDGAGTHLFERAADGTVTRLDPAGDDYATSPFFDAAGDAAGTYKDTTGGGIVTLVGGKLSTTSLTAPLGASRVQSVALDATGGAYGIYEKTGRYDTHAFYQPAGGAPVRIDPTTDISVDHNTLLSGGGTVAGIDTARNNNTQQVYQQVYVHAGGTTKTYDVPNGYSVALAGIDARGDVAGTFGNGRMAGKARSIAFAITGDVLSTLAPPPDADALAGMSVSGITASGLVAGTYTGTDGVTHLFTAQAGSPAATRLDPEGSTDASFVAGTFGEDGTPAPADGAVAVNYTDGSGASHGLVYLDGRVTVVEGAPGATSTSIDRVDAQGNVAGTYTDAAGGTHSFVRFAAATPTIMGTHTGATAGEAPLGPFAGVQVADANAGAIETLTVALSGTGGTLADGAGYAGLRQNADGSYALSGTAAAVTAELAALSFKPRAAGTTTFTLKDVTSVGGVFTNTATDAATVVTDTAAVIPPPAPAPVLTPAPAPGGSALTSLPAPGGSAPPPAPAPGGSALTSVPAPGGSAPPPAPAPGGSAPPPAPAPDAVSIAPQVGFKRGVFTLSGAASSSVGVSSVEITATLGDGTVKDLGAAAVNADGSFTFADRIGRRTQGFITATLTDGAGGTATGTAGFSLSGFPARDGFTAEQDTYNVDGSAPLSTSQFMPDGERTTGVTAPGQTLSADYTDAFDANYQGGNTFLYHAGHGANVVDEFRLRGAQHDTLSFAGSDFGNDVANVLAQAHYAQGGVVITDAVTQDTVQLIGVTKKQLAANAGDIAFHA